MTRAGKLKEGFDIPVFDSNTNKSKSIRKLSGGEATIVEDAVAKAICIYNKTSNGRDLATIYTDERDGALDPEKKRAYFRMKQKVLALGGYDQEYLHHPHPRTARHGERRHFSQTRRRHHNRQQLKGASPI